jgi:TetR/AcrR family transcriptional regulator
MAAAVRTRDAARTRQAILDAAEAVFARDGYDAASFARIGEAAGVSRATPSYFFGSKDELYGAVLERVYADRTAALAPAFGELRAWAEADAPRAPLRAVLRRTAQAYVRWVTDRPAYVDLIQREALNGAGRLPGLVNQSTVMEEAFTALRRRAARHGLRRVDVADAVLVYVGLGFTPVAQRHTVLPRHGVAYDDPRFVRRRVDQLEQTLVHLLGAG